MKGRFAGSNLEKQYPGFPTADRRPMSNVKYAGLKVCRAQVCPGSKYAGLKCAGLKYCGASMRGMNVLKGLGRLDQITKAHIY